MFKGTSGGILLCLVALGIILYAGYSQGFIQLPGQETKQTKKAKQTNDDSAILLKKIQEAASKACVACKGKGFILYKLKEKESKIDCLYCNSSATSSEKPIFITSKEICEAYIKDPKKVIQKYRGKKLIITGVIKGVGSIISGTEKRFWCTLEGYENVALNCLLLPNFKVVKESKGKLVGVVGTFLEDPKRKNEVMLTDCYIMNF